MTKTNKQKILDYLWSISPQGATNGQIRDATGVQPHQQVFMLTQELTRNGLINGEQSGREWVFRASETIAAQFTAVAKPLLDPAAAGLNYASFEELAQQVMSTHYATSLQRGSVPSVPKNFDLVSQDRQVVGDAKYFTLVNGRTMPPAKFSVIAEHVWLLEKTNAVKRFLVFGNDIQVPRLWLRRYGHLVQQVEIYFLSDQGELEKLN